MSLGTLLVYIAIAAIIWTGLTGMLWRKVKNWGVSFLQSFAGALFVFSGWVKAIDPLGTAYKMEQYFAEFESTFQETALSGIAPLFPWLSHYAVGFSVFMIVFEIILGIMLLTGTARRFTAWAFFLLVLFFTFLTGFTYLTGYVPEGVNFFAFGDWGKYVETNMKVTDCGCFGDFIKLKPKVSFLKDVFLLLPSLIFLFWPKQMHQLWTGGTRGALVGLGIPALLLYCFSNFLWDIPHTDFRPFKVGVNIAERKAIEQEAMAEVKVIAYRMTNKANGEVVELPYEQYLKEFQQYPSEEWELEQIKSKPSLEPTKISDFEVSDVEGGDVTEDILTIPGYSFMIVAYKFYDQGTSTTQMVTDSVYRTDTLRAANGAEDIVSVLDTIITREVTQTIYSWDPAYLDLWKSKLLPVLKEAQQAGAKAYAITKFADTGMLQQFAQENQIDFPIYVADDILLKTIVRSNPGVVLLKDGTIIQKWHISKLPDFGKIQADYWQD